MVTQRKIKLPLGEVKEHIKQEKHGEGPGETRRNSPSSQGDKQRQQFMQIFKTHEIARHDQRYLKTRVLMHTEVQGGEMRSHCSTVARG